ncbi:MAG TPA: VWA domain-containing protein [Bacteroidales bacterium]|nr:VWA domain-containing protein [Bacteroidales bacterium]
MKLKPKSRISKYVFLLILAMAFVLQLKAQMISQNSVDYPPGTTFSTCPGGSCVISLPSARFNQQYEFIVPISITPPYTFFISNVNGSCTEIDSNHILDNTDNTIHLLVTERCPYPQSNFISFTLNVTKGASTEQQQFIIPLVRDSIKLVMVLDISGSMVLPVHSGTGTRIDALKDAVNSFVPKLEEFQQDMGDSLAMTYFSSTVIQPDLPISDNFIVIDNTDTDFNNWSVIKVYNDLDARIPLQMTAMGEGLLDAKNKLTADDSPNLKRLVFLFTDGLQNYGNKVKDDGMSFTLTDDSLNNYSTNPKDSIHYFPVATWAAGDEPEILQEIASMSNGEVLFVTPSADLTNWFNNQLVNMLDDGSPQIVLNRSLPNHSGKSIIPFHLNSHIKTLLIELNSDEEINMQILRDGVDLTSKARLRDGDKFNILSFHFPIPGNNPIHSEGNWEIKLDGETYNPFYLSVIADDHYLNYECSSKKRKYTVGDTIWLKAVLSHNNVLLTGSSNTVKTVVLKPGDDLGDLLSNYDTPVLNDSLIDLNSGVAQKFNELMLNDSSFYNALLPEEQIVELTNDGNGVFKGYYTSTEIAGIYNIVFLMKGQIPAHGQFQRIKTISNIVVFGEVVPEEPEIVQDFPPAPSGSNNKYTVLKIRPVNKFGKYMGPGFKSKINLKPGTKHVKKNKALIIEQSSNQHIPCLSEIRDNLDGSYYLYIAYLSEDKPWDFSITVRDEVLHDYSSSLPWWVYLVVFIILLLVYLFKKAGRLKVILWILLIIWLAIIILHSLGYINFL